jgi:hypothetical protein
VPFKTRCCVDSDTPWFDASLGRVVLERVIPYRFCKANRNPETILSLCVIGPRMQLNTLKDSVSKMMSIWRRMDLGLKRASPIIGNVDVNGLIEIFKSLGPNAGSVAFSVFFSRFYSFFVPQRVCAGGRRCSFFL